MDLLILRVPEIRQRRLAVCKGTPAENGEAGRKGGVGQAEAVAEQAAARRVQDAGFLEDCAADRAAELRLKVG